MTEVVVAYGIVGALVGSLVTLFVAFMSYGRKNGNGALGRQVQELDHAVHENRTVIVNGQGKVIDTMNEVIRSNDRIATILDQRLPRL